jgi:hypothetical protein
MGGINFYRKFVSHFSQMARPLDQLTNEEKFIWYAYVQRHFDKLKKALCSAPVLLFPNLVQPFEIEMDALNLRLAQYLNREFT